VVRDERTIIDHENGISMINTTMYKLDTKPYILPTQCENVFVSRVLGRASWLYVVRFDPRGRPIKYIFSKEGVRE